jgi:hypothetical protein
VWRSRGNMAHDMDKWQAVVHTVMNFCAYKMQGVL